MTFARTCGLALAACLAGGTLLEVQPAAAGPGKGWDRCDRPGQGNRRACLERWDRSDRFDRRRIPIPVVDRRFLRSGSRMNLFFPGRDRIVLRRGEVLPLEGRLARDIFDNRGRILIPRNSRIVGQLRPDGRGLRFVSDRLILPNGGIFPMRAHSGLIFSEPSFGRPDLSTVLITGAARTLLNNLPGYNGAIDRSFDDALRGGNSQIIVLDSSDLDLELLSDLTFR
ncbi:hypothetical protein [Synechococcus elongatus]|uniref:Uncharacterized protein n=1 Tax=Synechococcus elongatus PCC 11802 TaxID=2283154 RepID=A0AAU6R5F4_SYNEL|nr:hypothetical protein [Synechococcus elongatus]QFZ91262.1 hypothetical protein EKO22_01655 [Synechococcus elongatus PCC 11802]